MAKMTRMTLAEALATGGEVDQARLDATTEADIVRHAREDGTDNDEGMGNPYPVPATVRRKLGLTQKAMAELAGIPLGTWRNWEQGRVRLDPAVQTLLRVLWKEPDAVRRAQHVAA